MTDLDKLEALAKAATPGEWHVGETASSLCIRAERPPAKFGSRLPLQVAFITKPPACSHHNAAFIAAANPATILSLIASARRDAEEIERLREAWRLCEKMVKAEDDLIADLVNDERYLDAMKMDFPITNRMRSMLARAAHTGEG